MKDLDKIAMWLEEIATEMKKARLYQMMQDLHCDASNKEDLVVLCDTNARLEAIFYSKFYEQHSHDLEAHYEEVIKNRYKDICVAPKSNNQKQEQ